MPVETTTSHAYAGFWRRVGAGLIDSILWGLIAVPVIWATYGPGYFESDALIAGPVDFLVSWVFPAFGTILFWIFKGATPGKMAIGARIVDARTGQHPTTGQFIGRYLAYFVSMLPLGLGLFWIAWDARKQGWHDKLAGTLVVRGATVDRQIPNSLTLGVSPE